MMREKLEALAKDLEDTEDSVNPNSYEMGFNDGKRQSGRKILAILASRPVEAKAEAGLRAHRKGYCDDCGTKIIDNCPRCGAPQCCPKCCHETAAPSAGDEIVEITGLREALDIFIATRGKHDGPHVYDPTVQTCQACEQAYIKAEAELDAALARTPPQKPAETPASPEVEARREIARRFSGPEGDAAAVEAKADAGDRALLAEAREGGKPDIAGEIWDIVKYFITPGRVTEAYDAMRAKFPADPLTTTQPTPPSSSGTGNSPHLCPNKHGAEHEMELVWYCETCGKRESADDRCCYHGEGVRAALARVEGEKK